MWQEKMHQQKRWPWASADYQTEKIQESGRDPERVEWGGSRSFKNHHIQMHLGDGLQLLDSSGQATSEPEPM